MDEKGPLSTYIPKAAWELRARRQRVKKMTTFRKVEWRTQALQEAVKYWRLSGDPTRTGSKHTSKAMLIYEIFAAAIKVATRAMQRMIGAAKVEALGNIARDVGRISPAGIFRRLREMNLGARQPKRWKSALPKLLECRGQPVSGRLGLDAVWMQHFGEMELGELRDTTEFIESTLTADFQTVDFQPDPTLVPRLDTIEAILRDTKVGKAVGLDRMPGELLKGCPARMAAVLQPLFAKSLLRGRQPLQWRGGLLIEALKKSGMESSLDGHRSLFVGSVFGKAYHRFVRACIIGRTEAVLRDTHFGARRGAPVVQASQVAVLYERAQHKHRRSSAILFVDARSAYYCVIRQLVYGSVAGEEDATMHRIMRHFNLPRETWKDLLQTIQDGGLLRQHGFTDHVRHVAKDLHDASFFVTRFSTGASVVETQLGSRPGESIADLIFAWIFHKVMDSMTAKLQSCNCEEVIPACDSRSLWGGEGEGQVPLLGPIWADDGAFMASHDEAPVLWDRACSLARSVLLAFLEHGLTPNLKRGKTEMLLTLRGRQSRMTQSRVFGAGKEVLELDLGFWGRQQLRLTTEYVHLGCSLDRGATLRFEAQRRTEKAKGAFHEHRCRIYQNRSIPLPVRGVLFSAMVESTLFNLEIWCESGPAWDRLVAGHNKLLRRLLVNDMMSEQLLSTRLSDLVAASEHPPLEIILRGKRLRYCITLVNGAPDVLWALLHYEGEWQIACRSDFCWLLQHDTVQWPPFDEATWPEWWHILKGKADMFRRAVRRATRSATAHYAFDGAIRRLQDAMRRDAYRRWPMSFRGACQEIWVCGPCRMTFKRKAHLACHLFKKHGRQTECRFFLAGAICTACGRDFISEDRLQRHLGYSTRCWKLIRAQGTTSERATPGIGSKEWKQRRRDFPILCPPQPADCFPSGSHWNGNFGEAPGEALVRKATWSMGEWLSGLAQPISADEFFHCCVRELLRFPLHVEEMADVLAASAVDVELCTGEELLDWSIAWAHCVKRWLWHARDIV